jgi:hypothetical protein
MAHGVILLFGWVLGEASAGRRLPCAAAARPPRGRAKLRVAARRPSAIYDVHLPDLRSKLAHPG